MESSPNSKSVWSKIRNPTAFWILGLCNNFGYVIMLSGAHDISHSLDQTNGTEYAFVEAKRHCNLMSTGVILLADIVPSIFIKLIAPFCPLFIHLRMIAVVALSIIGFYLVGTGNVKWKVLSGVVSTALAAGLGETSLLAYLSTYNSIHVISTWSSGTGAAGVFGALSYASITQAGVSPKNTVLMALVVPFLMAVAFWVIATTPKKTETGDKEPLEKVSLREKLSIIPLLMRRFMLPYALVYFSEYLINQGLFEVMYFPNSFLTLQEQYRWYSFTYQVGVFISRSSVVFIQIDNLWLLSILQFCNLIVAISEALLGIMNYLAIMFLFIFWEGLLGGGVYVNSYRRISNEINATLKLFAMSLNSFADSVSITAAALVAIPLHNAICKTRNPYESF